MYTFNANRTLKGLEFSYWQMRHSFDEYPNKLNTFCFQSWLDTGYMADFFCNLFVTYSAKLKFSAFFCPIQVLFKLKFYTNAMKFQRHTSFTLETDWAAAAATAKRQEKCRESIEKSRVTERQTKQEYVQKETKHRPNFISDLFDRCRCVVFSFFAKRATNKCTEFHLG